MSPGAGPPWAGRMSRRRSALAVPTTAVGWVVRGATWAVLAVAAVAAAPWWHAGQEARAVAASSAVTASGPGPAARGVGQPARGATRGLPVRLVAPWETTAAGGAYALPLPHDVVRPRDLTAPHHDYPASDLMVPVGTPVYAATSGRASVLRGGKCGVGVTIEGDDGYRYVNCHLSAAVVTHGQRVEAGQPVGQSGATGNAQATAPHLHFAIKNPSHRYICPQPLLVAWYEGRPLGPAEAETTRGCFFVG